MPEALIFQHSDVKLFLKETLIYRVKVGLPYWEYRTDTGPLGFIQRGSYVMYDYFNEKIQRHLFRLINCEKQNHFVMIPTNYIDEQLEGPFGE